MKKIKSIAAAIFTVLVYAALAAGLAVLGWLAPKFVFGLFSAIIIGIFCLALFFIIFALFAKEPEKKNIKRQK